MAESSNPSSTVPAAQAELAKFQAPEGGDYGLGLGNLDGTASSACGPRSHGRRRSSSDLADADRQDADEDVTFGPEHPTKDGDPPDGKGI